MARGITINIGINTVDPAVYGSPLALRGCENDARSMRGLAQAAGFDVAASTMLLSREATAEAVTGAIRAAASRLQAGDLLFLTYSGHGGQVPAPDDPDEPDGLSETWVLYDRMLLDDELNALWGRFAPGVRIFVLSDSCHSGTVVRDASGLHYDSKVRATLNSVPVLARELVGFDVVEPVTKELPFAVQAQVYWDNKGFYDGVPRVKDVSTGASVILISGCQDNQVSLDGNVNGLFTEKLLQVWGDGAFQGNHPAFRDAIARLLPPTQSPNFFTAGMPSVAFQQQRPLTIAPPDGTATTQQPTTQQPAAQPSIWDLLMQQFTTTKEKDVTQSTGQEKWFEFIPPLIDVGLQVVNALSKEGYQLQDPSGKSVAAVRDAANAEKWLEFIPLAISVGSQIYDALSKEGVLPANKQVALPKDVSADSTKGWLDVISVALQLGSQALQAATKDGYVEAGATPKLDDPEAKGWLDLIPIALDIGTQIYNSVTKSAVGGPMSLSTLAQSTKAAPGGDRPAAAAGYASKEVVSSFSKQVLENARM